MIRPTWLPGDPLMTENPADCGSQNGKAKSKKPQIVAQVARIVRKEELDYAAWRYVVKKVRQDL